MPHNKIRVTAIQRLCVDDGPGVRTVVFLKGCYLACPWCCNPEAIHYNQDLYYKNGECIDSSIICSSCEKRTGKNKFTECPINVYEKTFQDYSINELYNILLKDYNIYKSGGGITFSGGEPIMHAEQILPLLQKLKQKKISIALETTLYAPTDKFNLISPLIDYWLIDLKLQFGFIKNKDYSISDSAFEKNLNQLQDMNSLDRISYRMVFMSEITEKHLFIAEKLKEFNINVIELLPYHNLGKYKYKKLNKKFYQYGIPTNENLLRFVNMMIKHSILCKVQRF